MVFTGRGEVSFAGWSQIWIRDVQGLHGGFSASPAGEDDGFQRAHARHEGLLRSSVSAEAFGVWGYLRGDRGQGLANEVFVRRVN